MFQDFKKALTALVGVALLFLFFMVCYWISVAEPFTVITGDGSKTVAAGTMKIVEACLYMAYFMFGGAILTIIVTSFAPYIKQ
jgi:hypothetical protein